MPELSQEQQFNYYAFHRRIYNGDMMNRVIVQFVTSAVLRPKDKFLWYTSLNRIYTKAYSQSYHHCYKAHKHKQNHMTVYLFTCLYDTK